jgi:hypothetical protein
MNASIDVAIVIETWLNKNIEKNINLLTKNLKVFQSSLAELQGVAIIINIQKFSK